MKKTSKSLVLGLLSFLGTCSTMAVEKNAKPNSDFNNVMNDLTMTSSKGGVPVKRQNKIVKWYNNLPIYGKIGVPTAPLALATVIGGSIAYATYDKDFAEAKKLLADPKTEKGDCDLVRQNLERYFGKENIEVQYPKGYETDEAWDISEVKIISKRKLTEKEKEDYFDTKNKKDWNKVWYCKVKSKFCEESDTTKGWTCERAILESQEKVYRVVCVMQNKENQRTYVAFAITKPHVKEEMTPVEAPEYSED